MELPEFDPSIPLRPGLKQYIVEQDTLFGESFKHPLWYQVPYSPHFNDLINQGIAHKWKLIKQLRREGSWRQIIWFLERPYRPWLLHHIRNRLYGWQFWDLFRSVWLDAENTWQWLIQIQVMLRDTHVEQRHLFMDPKERNKLASMPDRFKVYRGVRDMGQDEDQGPDGFSWTLDRGMAEWFARRLATSVDNPHVVEGWVERDHVVAYLEDRGIENEIVVPIGTVDITDWESAT